MSHRLAELSWTELRDTIDTAEAPPIVLLPVGVLEQHGPHLPLGADSLVAERVAHLVADETGVLVAPAVNYGSSPSLRGFPGTIDLPADTLRRLLFDIMSELCRNGLRRIILVNNNGGNAGPGLAAAYEIKQQFGVTVGNLYPWGIGYELMRDQYSDPASAYGHGAEPEHSAMMSMFPKLVKQLDGLVSETLVHEDGWKPAGHFTARLPGYSVPGQVFWDFSEISPSGTSGDVSAARPELGAIWVERVVGFCAEFVRTFDKNTRNAGWAHPAERLP